MIGKCVRCVYPVDLLLEGEYANLAERFEDLPAKKGKGVVSLKKKESMVERAKK
jgi:hypothetical protein